MNLEIWTDVVCPWCGLGEQRLKVALERFPHRSSVRILHRSFQLDPNAPGDRTVPIRDVLRAKYGMSDAQFLSTTRGLQAMAEGEGLVPYRVGETQSGNTHLAHELAHFAAAHGRDAAIWERLYRAHFGELRSVFDIDSLVGLAVEVGLEGEAARTALVTGTYRAAVDADIAQARAFGCSGVPFFVFDRAFAVSGAQSPEVLASALMRAWDGRPESSASDDAAPSCGPETCDT
jgi:predicted DsbA family dithiol-disulfide isomerase